MTQFMDLIKRFVERWRDMKYQLSSDRQYEIAREMYYEQAERDGCEYPPQFKG